MTPSSVAAPLAPPAEGAATDLSTEIAVLREQAKRQDAIIADLGKGLGRVREKQKSGEPTGEHSAAAVGITQADLDAAIRYGQLSAALPPTATKHLETLRAEGLGYREAARIAEAMKVALDNAPATGAAPSSGTTATVGAGTAGEPQGASNRAPPGVAATAASRQAVAHPRTQREYVELCRSNPERIRQLREDPNFDLSVLPQR